MQFTMKSLEKLVETMDEEDFKFTKENFKDDVQYHLVKQKGVFPYDFFDSKEKLEYTSFPSRDKFFNTLNNEECKEKVRMSTVLSRGGRLFIFQSN